MNKNVRYLTHAAIIAALYAVLTHVQNILFMNSTNMMIQFRASEALCVLAFFTPAAIPGLTVGCLLFNMVSGASALDFLFGSAASLLAALGMWLTRKVTIKGYPLLGMLLPAVFNGLLVGWELTAFVPTDVGFWTNATCVAIGEAAVLLTLGTALFYAMKIRRLDRRTFGTV